MTTQPILLEDSYYKVFDKVSATKARNTSLYFTKLSMYVKNQITENSYKQAFNDFISAADQSIAMPLEAKLAVEIIRIINLYYPSRKDRVYGDCIDAANYWLDIHDQISDDIYPQYEIRSIIYYYMTNQWDKLNIPTGGTIIGKYTPQGNKITS
ncbi:MAG TPA: hypothetical protein VNR38_06170 [Ureibacillus sp.]|nr:hypothetical protein [Ureibacillus sp.]